jgi:hypothetical protein
MIFGNKPIITGKAFFALMPAASFLNAFEKLVAI